MKYVKMLGLLAVAAAALMAFAATASATTVTSNEGTTPTIEAEGIETTLHGAATITCKTSTVKGAVEKHGAGVTASGKLTTLTFSECGSNHVTPIKNAEGNYGSLEVHASGKGDGNGTLTSSGAEVQIQITSLNITCIYTTSNTSLGTVTGGSPASLDINSSEIPRTGGSGGIFCGSKGIWTGTYTVKKPSTLSID